MKIIFNLVSILIMLVVIFIASLNTQSFAFTAWVANSGKIIYQTSLTTILLTFFVAGTLAGVLWAASFYSPVQNKLKEYQRKLEKTSVATDEESSKVAVLEEKIKTLEAALQSALENKE